MQCPAQVPGDRHRWQQRTDTNARLAAAALPSRPIMPSVTVSAPTPAFLKKCRRSICLPTPLANFSRVMSLTSPRRVSDRSELDEPIGDHHREAEHLGG